MQPYIFPYIGYFQLINAVDLFVIYDNIQYTKKGWINRNRFLQNGKDAVFTIPIQNASDYLDVRERVISSSFNKEKLLNQLFASYCKSPYFEHVFPFLSNIINNNETNLFKYIHYSIIEICNSLNIDTKIVISSDVDIDHNLKSQGKVIAICQQLGATNYINPVGGQTLYSKEAFQKCGIDLMFIKSNPMKYKQFDNEFVAWLSVIDVMMFNNNEEIIGMLKDYDLEM